MEYYRHCVQNLMRMNKYVTCNVNLIFQFLYCGLRYPVTLSRLLGSINQGTEVTLDDVESIVKTVLT